MLVRRLYGWADACGCGIGLTDAEGRVKWDDLSLGALTVQAIRSGVGAVDVASATASVTREGEVGFAVLRFGGSGTRVGQNPTPDAPPPLRAGAARTPNPFSPPRTSTSGLV